MADTETSILLARQSVNVFSLNRGSIARLSMDPAELSMVKQRSNQVKFGLKYERRRTSSAYHKRATFFEQMSAIDKRNRTNRT